MIESARVRRAGPADARAIGKVHVESWRATYAGILPDRVLIDMSADLKASQWRRTLLRPVSGDAVLVAEVPEAGVVGFASCGRAQGTSFGIDGEVQTLYLLPDWQEQGLGRRLLCAALSVLKRGGRQGAFLWVLAANPSRFFYEAMGGIRIGEREEELWQTRLPEVAYGWPDLSKLPPACRKKGNADR
ncbi:MAG: N-acetyltransferase family protein [Dongiaceae bacterium]